VLINRLDEYSASLGDVPKNDALKQENASLKLKLEEVGVARAVYLDPKIPDTQMRRYTFLPSLLVSRLSLSLLNIEHRRINILRQRWRLRSASRSMRQIGGANAPRFACHLLRRVTLNCYARTALRKWVSCRRLKARSSERCLAQLMGWP
jgi:hypothetical protein